MSCPLKFDMEGEWSICLILFILALTSMENGSTTAMMHGEIPFTTTMMTSNQKERKWYYAASCILACRVPLRCMAGFSFYVSLLFHIVQIFCFTTPSITAQVISTSYRSIYQSYGAAGRSTWNIAAGQWSGVWSSQWGDGGTVIDTLAHVGQGSCWKCWICWKP